MKLTKRKGFNFFRSYYDVYNELENNEDKVAFIDALLDRQFLGKKPTGLKGMAKFAYVSQTNSIDSQVKGYEDKTGIKLKKIDPAEGGAHGGADAPAVQVQGKEKGEVEGKEKGIKKVESAKAPPKSLDQRKKDFYEDLKPFVGKYGKEMVRQFYDYWTEHGKNDKKLKFEKERSFGVSRRISSWKRNEQKFNPEVKSGNILEGLNILKS